MIRAGTLRHTVAIEQPVETVSATGKVTATWAEQCRLRAQLVSQEISEAGEENGDRETVSIVFRTHHRPGITTENRLSYNGSAHDITKVVELPRGLEIHCERAGA